MNKAQLASILLLMTAISGITYYTQNDHTTFLNNKEEENIYADWISWQKAFGKTYTSEELPLKFATFSKNYNFVKTFDPKKEKKFTVGLNQFADLTSQEFVALHRQGKMIDQSLLAASIPNSVNWETDGALPPAQNQGQCGASSVVASVDAIEALYEILHGKSVQFSIQQIIDCISGGQGCNGGIYPDAVYEYATKYGLESAGDYPYVAQQTTCQYDPSKVVFKLSGYSSVQSNNSSALLNAVAKQPVTALIEADSSSFQMYTGGIYDDPSCGTSLDTAIVVAGYQLGSQDYWIVQNSWGTSWGMSGNIYIAFDLNKKNDPGICGINLEASYPNA